MGEMRRKHCKHCKDGVEMVSFVFADDENCVVHYADYCPVCGRKLNNLFSEWGD